MKAGSGGNSDVQVSAVNTIGIATVSLRGFGANRSLVLVDGRRAIPTNSLMVVDVNNIPSSMIKRVEIISGGASATYGADAIGGVSNFLLRKDFQGLEVDTQWGTSEAGDGDEMRASAIIGTSINDGRGNMVLAAEYYDRKASFERNREFFTDGWKDPTTGGNTASLSGASGYNTSTGNAPNPAALRAILSGRPAGTDVYALPNNANYGNSTLFRFNPNQTIYNPVGNNSNSFGFPIDGYRYAYQNAYDTSVCVNSVTSACAQVPIQTVKYYANDFYVNSPQTRYSFMGSAKYDITDDLSFNTNVRFSESTTKSYLGPSTGGGGWGVSIPYNAATDSPVNPALDYTNATVVQQVLANPAAFANPTFIAHGQPGAKHPVPVQLAILLNSRAATTGATPRYCLTGSAGCAAKLPNGAANPNATTDVAFIGQTRTGRDSPWLAETYSANSFAPRTSVNTNQAWQIETGLNYKLPFADWTAEVYYSRGESSSYSVAGGNRSLARTRALFVADDYGRNSTLQSNQTNNPSLAQPGFGSVPVPCTSGFYETLFAGDAPASADCTYAISAPLQSRSQNQQDIVELNFQGGLFSLPAGQVRAAVGAQQRRNAAQFNPDILQSTASLNDQVIGLYPTGYLDAHMRARDLYAEALVPILEDTFVKKVELEIGGRYSDYDLTKSTWTYKVNGNVEVNDYVRFRGGYNRATRAPNLGELFLPLQELFGAGGYYGDPCGLLSTAPYGAAGAQVNNPLTGQRTALASGQTAAGAQSTYLVCRAQMGAGATPFYNAAPPAGTSFNGLGFTYQQGNANLESEVADTWTAGVVLRSPFEHPLLNRLTATVRLVSDRDQQGDPAVFAGLRALPVLRHAHRDHGCGSAGAGGDAGVPGRAARCRGRWPADGAGVVRQPRVGAHLRHRLHGELERRVRGHGPRGDPGQPRTQRQRHVARLLPHEAVVVLVRSADRVEGLDRTERAGLQRRRVRLPAADDAELQPALAERESPLAPSALGGPGQQGTGERDRREQRPRVGGRRRFAGELSAERRKADRLVRRVRPVGLVDADRHAHAALRRGQRVRQEPAAVRSDERLPVRSEPDARAECGGAGGTVHGTAGLRGAGVVQPGVER